MTLQEMSNVELVKKYREIADQFVKSKSFDVPMEYIDCLQEITKRFVTYVDTKEQYDLIHDGVECWYWDKDYGEPSHGKILGVNWKDGKIDSFGVEFDEDDFDEFSYEALGFSVFLSEQSLYQAMGGMNPDG